MNAPTVDLNEVSRLRWRIFAITHLAALPSAVVLAFILAIFFNLSPAQMPAFFGVLLPLAFVSGALFQFGQIRRLLHRALEQRPDDVAGARLRRLLELPRKLELTSTMVGWTIGGLTGGIGVALWFGYGLSGAITTFALTVCASFFTGTIGMLQVESIVRPYAVAEQQRSPVDVMAFGGLFGVRQRWYLPYVFNLSLLSMGGFLSLVWYCRFETLFDTFVEELRLHGQQESANVLVQRADGLEASLVFPVIGIAVTLLGAFSVVAWMLAKRQDQASKELEATLRSIADGQPRQPNWIAGDELGDLALASDRVAREMLGVFGQLRGMASGDLSRELVGDGGLLRPFREWREAMLKLSTMMVALSRGEVPEREQIVGDLGKAFERLDASFRAIVGQADTIARGDLRSEVDVPGALGESMRRMSTNLREMVGQTQSGSSSVADIVVSLRSATAQLSAATTEQVAAVTETANTMTEMAQTSAVSADRAAELIKRGEAAQTVVDEGGQAASTAADAMLRVAGSLSNVKSASAALALRVQQIEGITETVGFLADQSSTLAINAAIEAARAGESGKGFAVVAHEIRALASDSRKAATNIRELLGEIRERTAQVDGAVEAGGSMIEQYQQLSNRLNEVVAALGVTIHDAVGLMRQVEGSARQHQAGVAQVSGALSNMQKASESIRDGARLLGELSSSAGELAGTLRQTSSAYQLPEAKA